MPRRLRNRGGGRGTGKVPVRVAYQRTGGFAAVPGLERQVVIDADDLPADERSRLEEAVDRAASLAGPPPRPEPGDRRTYTVEITGANGPRTVTLTDPVPEDARPLVDLLEQYRRRRLGG